MQLKCSFYVYGNFSFTNGEFQESVMKIGIQPQPWTIKFKELEKKFPLYQQEFPIGYPT